MATTYAAGADAKLLDKDGIMQAKLLAKPKKQQTTFLTIPVLMMRHIQQVIKEYCRLSTTTAQEQHVRGG
jgi:hypothetical protein